jgi:hypothetical protein
MRAAAKRDMSRLAAFSVRRIGQDRQFGVGVQPVENNNHI